MRVATVAAVVASCSGVIAQQDTLLGFNSGATDDTGKAKTQAEFEKEFDVAQKLQNSPGSFNSIRLYTNIQPDTDDTPIEAFPAAIKTNTKLLLGIWASGTTSIEKELSALTKAVDQYGKNFTDLVIGISVGSEDLYRMSEIGMQNNAGVGQEAPTILGFIKDVRDSIKDTGLSNIKVGHVDTWSAWVNESNKDVLDEVDFVGTNLFPYYESDKRNDISNATFLFQDAINKTEEVAGDKEVWITETGWPATGPDFGEAKATLDNAKTFWDDVGCTIFGRKNVFWYTLRDSNPDNKPKFALTDNLSTTAKFNLSCPAEAKAPTAINNDTPTDKSAGTFTSVSYTNAMAVALSMAFAVAAWIV